MDQIKERCIYCGSDVYYTGTEVLIKCGMCGHTLVVAKFENELARMNLAIEEGEQAKKDLAEAEKARQDAQVRLQEAMASLGGIKDGQDVLSILMRSVMAGQDSSEDKLAKLQDISARILNSQGDLLEGMAVFGEIKDQLGKIGLDTQAQKDYARDFVNWFQNIHEDDLSRLEEVDSKSTELLAGQKEISDKLERLQSSAAQTQEKLDEFHSQWKESQLEELRHLYHQAENYQHDRIYDKAYEKYEQVVTKGGGDAEIMWRMLLCHYCVSYQRDDKGNLIPIILNPDLTSADEMSIRKDLAFQLEKAAEEVQAVYRTELAVIDRILNHYRTLSSQHDYDVFISVKQDIDGRYTQDSNVASDLYDFLTGKGLKVFNSRRTPIPAGKEYEPYIIAALCSAKALIVVGTSADNMNAEWVRNEWTRYQWLQKSEVKKTGKLNRLLMCYIAGTMDFSEIPRALNQRIQAIRAGINDEQQLLTALKDLIPQHGKETEDKEMETEAQSARQVIAQMTTWLFMKKFDKVLEKYESLTEEGMYLDEVQVHLSALCAQKKVSRIEGIVDSETDLNLEPLYQLALSISEGTGEHKILQNYLEKNIAWRDKHSAAKAKRKKQEKKEAEVTSVQPCEKGLGRTEEDEKEAFSRYSKDASKGDKQAQYLLGLCYLEGRGARKNRSHAIVWLKKSSNQNYEPAKDKLSELGVDLITHRNDDGKILDSWEEIIENIGNKTYHEKYVIGDTKELDLGPEGIIEMQLVAFDEDELADGSGKAPTTWIARQLLKNRRRMNPPGEYQALFSMKFKEGTGACGGWEKSELRGFLQDNIRNLMP